MKFETPSTEVFSGESDLSVVHKILYFFNNFCIQLSEKIFFHFEIMKKVGLYIKKDL